MQDTLLQAAALIVPLIIAIVFHEVAHGWVARALGDPTAYQLGRLTLNPLKHVDPMGTIIVPGMLALTGLPVFGWAKPVPVYPWRLRNPRFGMVAVAAAGPMTNFLLAGVGAVALGVFAHWASQSAGSEFLGLSLTYFIVINVSLGLFNLLPLPPFDGSHIVEGLLPRAAAEQYRKLRPLGFPLMFILLLVVPYFWPSMDIFRNLIAPPIRWAVEYYDALARVVAGV